MKKFFLLMIGLFIFSLGIFAAVPHSYVTENPTKEITQTKTLKRKDKAELNLTITKKNSKEAKVEKAFYNTSTGLFYIVINGKEYNISPVSITFHFVIYFSGIKHFINFSSSICCT